MRLIRKSRYQTLTHYFVEWNGLEVWMNINDGVILDSSLKRGSDSEKLLFDFCLNQ